MKLIKHILSLVLILAFLGVHGQSTNQYIIAPLTAIYNGSNDINLIAAEPLNKTSSTSNSVITQGFLQPESFIYLSVEEQKESFFRFYPNPVSDGIFIEFKRECGQQMEISIISYLGQEISRGEYHINFQNRFYLPLNELSIGVYLLKIYDKDKDRFSTLKLIKK